MEDLGKSGLQQLENALGFEFIKKNRYANSSIRGEIKRLRPEGETGKEFKVTNCYDKFKLIAASGFGIATRGSIKKDACIGEYVGIVKHNAETKEDPSDYAMDLLGDYVIDAKKFGNLTRFINHSCNPNLLVELQWVKNECRPFFFARRNIKRGEELTYQYRFQYQKNGKQKECKCGSSNCTGWMGIMQNERRDRLQCVVCKKVFSFRQGLAAHMLTHDTKRKRFQCNQCNQNFAFRSGLSRHVKTEHKDPNRLICPGCQKQFTRPCEFVAHKGVCKELNTKTDSTKPKKTK